MADEDIEESRWWRFLGKRKKKLNNMNRRAMVINITLSVVDPAHDDEEEEEEEEEEEQQQQQQQQGEGRKNTRRKRKRRRSSNRSFALGRKTIAGVGLEFQL
ncbi:hypothetical protein PoB_000480000 [Plakobranchus ocellatus]|uniref:Uncharacterized protein n=1 Tax=Plakobranchus ocellatus TaxID=259542 RepID=A0AAV3Y741_9GAST|nr:hypothetical protein PoB_000480000 [Plakobranchus ocellatus]